MAEQKKTISLFGRDTQVVDVPIVKATEHFNEYEMEDGSVLLVKSVASSIMRVEGQYSLDGKPFYLVLTTPVVNVVHSTLSGGE